MIPLKKTVTLLLPVIFFLSGGAFFSPAYGQYTISAHGDSANGVNRAAMAGYARANCAHCHEQHASVGGNEPDPVLDGNPSPYELFTLNFDNAATPTYQVQDDICFRCHDSSSLVQSPAFDNNDYSETFGCATAGSGVTNIMAAFNQAGSYHDLADIWTFVDGDATNYPWFNASSNPCSACHNPHLARRNNANPRDVAFSALSLPTDHTNLFITSMNDTFAAQYEPPYCTNSGDREPAGSLDGPTGRANTIDYVTFCTDCHNLTNTAINSTPLGRNLLTIDWAGATGDKHGIRLTDGSNNARLAPYLSTNYVLSCLDCHESHGSPNITLLRRRVNAGNLGGGITTALNLPPAPGTAPTDPGNGNNQMGYLCERCHQGDAAPVPGTPPSWQAVHHTNTGAPYTQSACNNCHTGGGGFNRPPISCELCHFHGGDDSWLSTQVTGLRTF